MVPLVPVPQPVMRDPEGDGLVAALAELAQYLRGQGGVPAGAGLIHGLVRLAQDRDEVARPGLQAAGAKLHHGAASADDVGIMPIPPARTLPPASASVPVSA